MSSANSRPPDDGRGLPLVIGVGNPWRTDDGVGRLAARLLQSLGLPGLRVVELDGEAAGLIEAWTGHEEVLILDAASSGAAPGTVHRFDGAAGGLPVSLAALSCHGLGVGEAVELARALGKLPRRLTVVAVEGEDFTPGGEISRAVGKAARQLAGELARDLRARL